MIDPRHRTGCAGFDRATDLLFAGFIRTATQFSRRIPTTGMIDDEGRDIPNKVKSTARALAAGGLLHEFGNPSDNRQGWRIHGWAAVDANGAAVAFWVAQAGVARKVMRSLKSSLFAAPSVDLTVVRFPARIQESRAPQTMADRQAAQDDRYRARIHARAAKEAARLERARQAEARRFALQTTAIARLQELDRQAEEKLDAILENA